MLIPIEQAPPKVCFLKNGLIFCTWVKKGDMALMTDDGRYICFQPRQRQLPKAPSPEDEEAEAEE